MMGIMDVFPSHTSHYSHFFQSKIHTLSGLRAAHSTGLSPTVDKIDKLGIMGAISGRLADFHSQHEWKIPCVDCGKAALRSSYCTLVLLDSQPSMNGKSEPCRNLILE